MEEIYSLLVNRVNELRSLLVKMNAGVLEEKPIISTDILRNEYTALEKLIWIYDMESEVLKKSSEEVVPHDDTCDTEA